MTYITDNSPQTLNDDASRREHIPALVISGSSSEAQLVVAGRRYSSRHHVMASVLGDLINIVSRGQVSQPAGHLMRIR